MPRKRKQQIGCGGFGRLTASWAKVGPMQAIRLRCYSATKGLGEYSAATLGFCAAPIKGSY